MDAYLKLGLAALIPVIAAALFYELETRTVFGKWSYFLRQLIIGVVFGGIAILGTEWGIRLNNAQMTCRDAAPLVAGLLFGGPAGVIAGVIGGVERWIAVAWGVSSFTRVACTVSTILAGIYAALLRRLLFDEKRPGWSLALATGVVIEVFHLAMVFVTNMKDTVKAAQVVETCAVPMVLATGLSVMLASGTVQLLEEKTLNRNKGPQSIAQKIQHVLLLAVVVAFLVTTQFAYNVQTGFGEESARVLLENTLEDVRNELDSPGAYAEKVENHRIGDSGLVMLLDQDGQLVGISRSFQMKPPEPSVYTHLPEGERFPLNLDGTDYQAMLMRDRGITILGLLPDAETYEVRKSSMYVNTFMEILVFGATFLIIYLMIKNVVVDKLRTVNRDLGRIVEGDLDVRVGAAGSEEIENLSRDINLTVDTLKHYIEEASNRIARELQLAKDIQASALPGIFPDRKELTMYALMDPAKEVGGDFYDFYFNAGNRMNFVVADVSGKGIPAAMFMMRAKTALKSLADSEMGLDEAFTRCNSELCTGNDAEMFVTAWMGSLDVETGELIFANAGHNPPLLMRAGESFEYLRTRAGFVLAGLDGVKYKSQSLTLAPGDVLFLYTDGVPEATRGDGELFGEERLQAVLNAGRELEPQALCEKVQQSLEEFVGDAPQFDDITMMAIRYRGKEDGQDAV